MQDSGLTQPVKFWANKTPLFVFCSQQERSFGGGQPRLEREMRSRLILHETGFTCLRCFTSYFIDVDTFYLFLNWFSKRVSDDRKYVCGL